MISCFIFPPPLISGSVLPGETENLEIAYFHLNGDLNTQSGKTC